jgi:hypothetical protein
MKLIIAGSRGLGNLQYVCEAYDESPFIATEIVSGGAKGIDSLGERYAHILDIPVIVFKPDWSIGKHAGMIRNKQMGDYADALLAIWDGTSKGTKHMITYMESLNKPVFVYEIKN